MGDCWVIGPIAWDTIARVPRLPERGGFVQAAQLAGRPGGVGVNVAIPLARTGATVPITGYTGGDQPGRQLRAVLSDAGTDISEVQLTDGRTSEVLIMIEP